MKRVKYVRRQESNEVEHVLFNGDINQLAEVVKTENFINRMSNRKKGNITSLEFANQPSIEIANERLLNGCPDMFARYQRQAAQLPQKGYSSKTFVPDSEGIFFDVPTFLTGVQEYWINESEETAPSKSKELRINISIPCFVNESDIFAKLIKIVELIDATEAAGQRLNIFAVYYTTDFDPTSPNCSLTVELKKENEPLNLQQMVYLLANPILLRYCALGIMQTKPYSYNPITNMDREIELTKQHDFLYIPSIGYDYQKNICCTGNGFDYSNINLIEQYNLHL